MTQQSPILRLINAVRKMRDAEALVQDREVLDYDATGFWEAASDAYNALDDYEREMSDLRGRTLVQGR